MAEQAGTSDNTPPTVEDNNQRRIKELKSLESHFFANEYFMQFNEENNSYHGFYLVSVCVTNKINVILRDFYRDEIQLSVRHLPKIELHVTLPYYYPSEFCPVFTVHSSWLTLDMKARLSTILRHIWWTNRGKEILKIWITFLEENTLEYLDSSQTLVLNASGLKPPGIDVVNIQADIEMCVSLIRTLISWNEYAEEVAFFKTLVSCTFCAKSHYGYNSAKFNPCGHHFCWNCAKIHSRFRVVNMSELHVHCPMNGCFGEVPKYMVRGFMSPTYLSRFSNYN